MRKTWILVGLLLVASARIGAAQEPAALTKPPTELSKGFINVPGMSLVFERIQEHGFLGQAWDLKARPHQTIVVTLNNEGPFYFTLGAYWDALEDEAHPMGGLQFDAFHIWRSARDWPLIKKMDLITFPKDWRLLLGPNGNVLRTRPDHLRIDRDLLFNAALHISFGGGS